MKKPWLLILLSYACANPIPPTGGPKDLDPPVLVNTIPENKTLNFNGSEVIMEFDEYIKEENLLTQLMITPNLPGVYTYRLNRNRITISFEEPFDSATTYTFNFREGIKDITEGNIPPNLKFVFSTGNFLDSASVHGIVRSVMTHEVLEDITVSLYIDPDTMNIFNGPPRYIAITDEEGKFSIENIKNGSYLLYGVNDKNHNLKLESRTEGYGFLNHAIEINDSLPPFNLFIYNLDTRPIVLQSSRPIGNYYDLKFNKALTSYKLFTEGVNIVSNFVEDNETLRIYNNQEIADSLGLRFVVEDSLQQTLDTLVYVKFQVSDRKPENFNSTLDLKNGPVNRALRTSLKFNKPITYINYDSIYFRFDSLYTLALHDTLFTPNYSKDEFIISFDFNQYRENDSLLYHWTAPFEFVISEGSIISVENDSIKEIKRNLSFKDPKEFGIIRGTINTNYSSYFIQLIDGSFDVIKEIKVTSADQDRYEFLHVEPGTYSIRVLVDENENGIWDPGNINLNKLPENVLLFHHPNTESQQINLRANWEQSGLELRF